MNISYMFVCFRHLNTVFIHKHTAMELHLFCAVFPISLAFKAYNYRTQCMRCGSFSLRSGFYGCWYTQLLIARDTGINLEY